MKILALDFGARRVGVAIADTSVGVALPRDFLAHNATLLPRLADLLRAEKIGRVLIGLPQNLSGTDSHQTQTVRDFATQVETCNICPVEFVDERRSSVEAAENLRAAGLPARKQKNHLDSEAARIFLAAWLERA